MIVKLHPNAPDITLTLEERLNSIENIDDCILSVQLDYREANTLFYLHKVDTIYFNEHFIEIKQKNNSLCYLDYNMILEYCIINADDLIEVEEGYL